MTRPYAHVKHAAGNLGRIMRGTANAGASAAAAAGRGLRTAGQVAFAPTGKAPRDASAATRISAGVKGNFIRPGVYAATVPVGAHILSETLNQNDAMAQRELAVQQELMRAGMSAPEARDAAWKATYGLVGNTALHVAQNPYHYLIGGGGTSPIDQGVSEVAGSFVPPDLKTWLRQTGNVFTQGPVGGAATVGTSALMNLADSAGDRLPQVMQQYARQAETLTPEQMAEQVEGSRYAKFLQDYLGESMVPITQAYNQLSPEQQALRREALIRRGRQLAAPYVQLDMGQDGTPIVRAGPELSRPLTQSADAARQRYMEMVKRYAPTYVRRDLGVAFNRARRSVEEAPNPVQAGEALGQSISDSASAIGQRHGPTMAIDAYNRWNSERNPLRGVVDPLSVIKKVR